MITLIGMGSGTPESPVSYTHLGTWLMAASPTGWSSPALVTRPTPLPPEIRLSVVLGSNSTAAITGRPVAVSYTHLPADLLL